MEGNRLQWWHFGADVRKLTVLLIVMGYCFAADSGWAEDQGGNKSGRALHKIRNIIVVYQENWSFDSLYGEFPGANGRINSSPTSLNQLDRLNGQPLSGETSFNRAYTSGPSTLSIPPEALNSATQID